MISAAPEKLCRLFTIISNMYAVRCCPQPKGFFHQPYVCGVIFDDEQLKHAQSWHRHPLDEVVVTSCDELILCLFSILRAMFLVTCTCLHCSSTNANSTRATG